MRCQRDEGTTYGDGAISCTEASLDAQSAIAKMRGDIVDCLAKKISKDISAGAMPSVTNAKQFAQYIMVVIQGMSTLVRDGVTREELLAIAETALMAWPV
ncbi:hypothetical protein BH11CYA1_BH11CYA1_39640 [soil metagenome]